MPAASSAAHSSPTFANAALPQFARSTSSRSTSGIRRFDDVENLSLDLNVKENCEIAAKALNEIYNLAANMGGMGFIENNKALCMLSVLINTHMLQAAHKHGVRAIFLFLLGLRL